MYCIGWGRFDNQLSRIIDKGFFIKVKGADGVVSNFVSSAECRTID